ncbi:xylanase deacetylase [Rhodococcus sp. 06-418-1B]|nr:polysaccharide deacetylase [Rhodococcus sp. 06-418-1B]OZC83504.1 xylanase deacetylase [Rhodococcus sp. 06-418-1B]
MGHLQLPAGKKIAVNLGTDFDAQSLWMGGFNKPSPSFMSRGEYGAKVGVPRLLDLYGKYDIKTTWFTPGHTIDTFTRECELIAEQGHEFGHHGYFHENPTLIDAGTEEELVERAFATFDSRLGIRPTGYRSPYWDYSDNTLDIVEKMGFKYDSSLMGRDLEAYRPQRWAVDWENGNKPGKASHVLELPVSWYLDDFPPLACITGIQAGQQDSRAVFERWRDIFDYGYERIEGAAFVSCVHPQIIGQPHHMMWYEKLIQHMVERDGVWFATTDEIADCWVDDEEDKKNMALPDIRTTAARPDYYPNF